MVECRARAIWGLTLEGMTTKVQAGICNGCQVHFSFRNFTVDHVVAESRGGTDHIDNLQLLCAACKSEKGDRPMSVLLERLRVKGILD